MEQTYVVFTPSNIKGAWHCILFCRSHFDSKINHAQGCGKSCPQLKIQLLIREAQSLRLDVKMDMLNCAVEVTQVTSCQWLRHGSASMWPLALHPVENATEVQHLQDSNEIKKNATKALFGGQRSDRYIFIKLHIYVKAYSVFSVYIYIQWRIQDSHRPGASGPRAAYFLGDGGGMVHFLSIFASGGGIFASGAAFFFRGRYIVPLIT